MILVDFRANFRWYFTNLIRHLFLLEKNTFLSIILSTFFAFDNKIYKRKVGIFVAFSISSLLADMVMDDLEQHCLLILGFVPKFYFRFVDDIILCIPRRKLQYKFNIFNSYDPILQFTFGV